jgi:AcrR family transcriptional regulator
MDKAGARKSETERKLVAAAVSLFSRKWYNTVSVAEICRSAGLSNGIFYKYFDGKEALFRRILETVIDRLRERLAAVRGDSPRERLAAFIDSLVEFTEANRELVSVFREGQYRFFEYERKLADLYSRSLSQALGRDVGLAEYLFALGGIRFCAVRKSLHGVKMDLSALPGIVERGLFHGLAFDAGRVFGGSVTPLPLDLGTSARERLLAAGKRLFGDRGFFETNVHEITDAAGLSVGAFYSHFESKEAFLAELIGRAGRDIRAFIASNLGPAGGSHNTVGGSQNLAGASQNTTGNRLERELRGIWLFLIFLSIDRHCYAIVREAEFVLPESVREYYGAFVDGYRKNPEGNGVTTATGHEAEETAIEFLLGISHYFGIEVAFDSSPANARGVIETMGKYLAEGFSSYL